MTDEARQLPEEERRSEARHLQARHAAAKHAVYSGRSTDSDPGSGRADAKAPPAGAREPSHPSLLRELVDDVAVLIRKELALASAEVRESIGEARRGFLSLAAGGGVLYAGILFLLLAATLGLAEVMPAWLAALIVGGVVGVIGLVMVQSGTGKASSAHLTPERTMRSMRQDRAMVARHT